MGIVFHCHPDIVDLTNSFKSMNARRLGVPKLCSEQNLHGMKLLIFLIACVIPMTIKAQVAINSDGTDPHPSAMLHVKSTKKGFLTPRLTIAQRDNIANPAGGLLVYVQDDSTFYYYTGTIWTPIESFSNVLADADNDTRVEVESAPDVDEVHIEMGGDLYFRLVNGKINVQNTGQSVFLGNNAGLLDNGSNNRNVYIGEDAGSSATAANWNVAVGHGALKEQIVGGLNYNTAIGGESLYNCNGGTKNAGIGFSAMRSLTVGSENTTLGNSTLYSSTSGNRNTAVGFQAGHDAFGSGNVFLGYKAGFNEGGDSTLYIENTPGGPADALIYGEFDNDILSFNAKVGIGTQTPSVALEVEDMRSGSILMSAAVAEITNKDTVNGDGLRIQLGTDSYVSDSNNEFIQFYSGGAGALQKSGSISGDGMGGILLNGVSDARLKSGVRNYEQGLETVMAMRPTVYEMNVRPGVKQVGLIAQELYEVFPQVVSGTPDQPVEQPMMIDYGRLTPVLIDAIQQQQEMIEKLEARISELEKN